MLSPDGQWRLDEATNQWVPNAAPTPPPPPPQAAPAPPPPPYAQQQQQQMAPAYSAATPPSPNGVVTAAIPPAFGGSAPPWGGPPVAAHGTGSADLAAEYPQGLDFNDPAIVKSGALTEGEGVVRIDDVDYNESKEKSTPMAVIRATVTHGAWSPGRTSFWQYPLTTNAIFRLGKELVNLDLPLRPDGQRWSSNPRTLVDELRGALRGMLVKISVTPQIDRVTKEASADGYMNTRILARADAAGQSAQPAPQQQAGAAPAAAPQVAYGKPSYPQAGPPPVPQTAAPAGFPRV